MTAEVVFKSAIKDIRYNKQVFFVKIQGKREGIYHSHVAGFQIETHEIFSKKNARR
jgi:hypothetical protein